MAKRSSAAKKLALVTEPVRLDFGCGMHPIEGFEGVDILPMVGVKHVMDIRQTPWKWANNSVEKAHASHFIEHLNATERCAFYNELYRVLVPGGTCQIITPHWASNRAYGDPTHQWPPVAEMSFYYLSAEWRKTQAPHTDAKHWPKGYACNFVSTWGYAPHQLLLTRNTEYQQHALQFWKEAAQDLLCTLTKA